MPTPTASPCVPRKGPPSRAQRTEALTIRPATEDDAHALAPIVREADRMEIAASSGADPLLSLLRGIAISTVTRAVVDSWGRVVAIYGAREWPEYGGKLGQPWLIGADSMYRHRREVLQRTVEAINTDLAIFPALYGFSDCRNTVHLKWIERCGFTLHGFSLPSLLAYSS